MRYIALVFILFFSLNTTAEHSHKTPKNHVLKDQVFLEIFLNNKGKIVKNNQEISYNKLKTALFSNCKNQQNICFKTTR